jgi:hypothetical protein
VTTRTMRHDSREYLGVNVTADVELDEQPVSIAVHPYSSTADPTLSPAEWVGDAGTTREARILVGPGGDPSVVELTRGSTYRILVKVTDNPEAPVVEAYQLKVT